MVVKVGAEGMLYLLGLVVPPAVIGAVVERLWPSRRRVQWPLGSMPAKCLIIVIGWALLYLLFVIAIKS